jgi:hypothetical protein
VRLTERQRMELYLIAAGSPSKEFPAAGASNSREEKALIEKGLVRKWVESKPFGGPGAIGFMTATFAFVALTEKGERVFDSIAEQRGEV